MPAFEKADLERRMAGAVEALKQDLVGLRTGRASTSLLARMVAVRSPSSSSAISPKVSPGPRLSRDTSSPRSPRRSARAEPETMT